MTRRTRILIAVVTVLVAVALVSSTVGQAIYAGRTPGLGSFATVHFAGYLFFLLMPVEALVPYYQAGGTPGRMCSSCWRSRPRWRPRRLTMASAAPSGRGSWRISWDASATRSSAASSPDGEAGAILTFNLFPLSSPNMLLVAGMSRFGAVRALALSAAGLLTKYVAIVYLFDVLGGEAG